jgi:integrase
MGRGPNLRQKPSGRWEARYRDDRGRLRGKTFATKVEARRFLARVNADVQRGDYVDPRGGKEMFGSLATAWLASGLHWKPLTRRRYEGVLTSHLLPEFQESPVGSIDRHGVQEYLGKLVAGGLSPGTVRKIYAVLRMVLDTAVETRALRANPAIGVRLPKASARKMLVLEAFQVEQLAVEVGAPYELLIRFAAWSGLRAGEIAGLQLSDVDLLRARVQVATSVADMGGALLRGDTKNSRVRMISIPADLRDEIAAYLNARGVTGAEPDAALFVGPKGGPLRHGNFYSRRFRPAVGRALPPSLHGLRFHDLRHTCASLLIANGWHPKAVSDHLGHASIQITMDLYGHLLDSYHDALVARLDEAYGNARRAADRPQTDHTGPQADHETAPTPSSSRAVSRNEKHGRKAS